MRLRFLDLEPEEVFEAAKNNDARCMDFKRLWHKALAAASATSIHMAGKGKFFLTGFVCPVCGYGADAERLHAKADGKDESAAELLAGDRGG